MEKYDKVRSQKMFDVYYYRNILFCDRAKEEERNGNSRESKSLEFEKRNFHIVKRMKNHGVKFNEILKPELDGAYDDDIVSSRNKL